MKNKSFYAVSLVLISALFLSSCAKNEDNAVQPQDDGYAIFDQSEGDFLTFKYPSDWVRAGGDIDFANVQEFDSMVLLTFTSAPKIGDSIDSPQLSGLETYEQFRSSFLSDPYETVTYEDWNAIFGAIEVITYSSAAENGIYVLPEGAGTVALWQYGKKNYALVDPDSLHQENGEFEDFLKSIGEAN